MTNAMPTSSQVTGYRSVLEAINDQLNTMQAEFDEFSGVVTYEASAMCSDLSDMARNVELLARTIKEKSIRPIER